MLLRAATINAPHSAGRRAWRRCWGLTARRADVFCLNESWKAQRRLYLALCKANGYGYRGGQPNVVCWDKRRYREVSARTVALHQRAGGWRSRVWPGYNDARSVTEVVLDDLRDGPEVAVLATHWVPEGRKVARSWRREMRRRSKATVTRLTEQHQAAGRVVVLLGDLNVHHIFDLPPFTWVRDRGADRIAVATPEGWRIVRTAVHPYDAPTDHKRGYAARIRIEETSR